MYNIDQWKIFKFLGAALPKRESFKIGDIKDKQFKQAPNDRVVRNAIRKPVKEGHIEICERGEYRFTPKGAAFFQKMEKEGFKPSAVRAMAKPAKKEKKPVAKKAAPKKEAKPEKPVKKIAKPAPKKIAKPSNGTKVEAKPEDKPAPKKSSVKIPRPKTDESEAKPENGEVKKDSPQLTL